MFHVLKETETSIQGIGIMYTLPVGELPVEISLSRAPNATSYQVWVGQADDRWSSLTESKRWKAVYLYAKEGHDSKWDWSEPVSGHVPDT